MNRYLMGALLGGLALLVAFSSGLADWLGGVNSREGAAGVRATGLTADGEGAGSTAIERAGQAVQRQSSPTAASGQNTGATGDTTTAAGNNANQNQPSPGAGTGTGTGTGTGASQLPQQTPQPAAGTPAPANLEAIPALW